MLGVSSGHAGHRRVDRVRGRIEGRLRLGALLLAAGLRRGDLVAGHDDGDVVLAAALERFIEQELGRVARRVVSISWRTRPSRSKRSRASRWLTLKPHFSDRWNSFRLVLIASRLATSPAAIPPMPSATMNK